MRAVEALISALWIVFWIYWLAAAMAAKRPRAESSRYRQAGIRAGLAVVIVVVLRTNFLGGGAAATGNPVVEAAGIAVLMLGLAAAVWARVYLGRNWGMPMSEKVSPELVTTGPYRYVRHPVYAGIIVAMIGTAVAVGIQWLLAAALFGAYFVYSASVEERSLNRLFPATYPAYRRSTKMLIPFLL
jgi:protein-S-isoprenylcysteine O-methyltransferase Ste14